MNLIFVTCLVFGQATGFLIQGSGNNQSLGGLQSSPDMTTQYLLGLIVDEKNSRHQLENIVNLMGNKIDELEKEIASKETETVAKLKQINAKLSQVEQYHTDVSRELQKETNNRQHLEEMYAMLEKRLDNMTKELDNHKADTANVTNVENKVHDLAKELSALENRNLTHLTGDQVGRIERELQTLAKNISSINDNKEFVGFSVISPNAATGTVLRFTRDVFNPDGAYNHSTGQFTCKVPGVYLLSVTIIKDSSDSECSCNLKVNSQVITRVFANSNGATSSFSSASSAIVYELHTGDTVYLGDCSDIGRFYTYETSFSGALIGPSMS